VASRGTPVCIAALYCNSVVNGQDNTLSIIQTIDTIFISPETQFKIGEVVDLGGPLRLVVLLKQGDAVGRHEMEVSYRNPDGTRDPIGKLWQDFPPNAPPEMGYNFIAPVRLRWRGLGLYWLELRLGKKLLARTPLNVKYMEVPSKQ
jgi:hypothetical protein